METVTLLLNTIQRTPGATYSDEDELGMYLLTSHVSSDDMEEYSTKKEGDNVIQIPSIRQESLQDVRVEIIPPDSVKRT